ncbi:protease 3 precursor [bacterium BMS3Abin09]|nr:protease 3 precursor [bacterium BMS3Abin09]GBE41824.1 protease 3 precursor [bacterium BMS3Bbin09]
MKKYLLLFLLTAMIIFPGYARGMDKDVQENEAGYIHEEVLPNGLKVLAVKDPNAPLAVFQIWYNAGSVFEQVGKTGLSHLLEHMMFKGTKKHGPGEFSKIIKRAGGVDNAGTTKDFTFYYQKLAPDRLHLSIKLEADRMRNLIMDPDETLSERDVVMEERRMRYEDDPQNLVYEEVMAAAFKSHPYRWPVIGWMPDLKTITRDNLWKYYRARYIPNNALIVVAGNIDVEAIMKKIKKEFGPIPKGPEIELFKVDEPLQRGERRVYVEKEAELPYVMCAYKTPNVLHEDSYALDVLAGVLSGGKSSRIYRSLIDEQRIALSAGAGYSSFNKYPNLFYLYGTPLPGKNIEDVENALYAEIEKIQREAPSEREVQKAKNQIEADFIMNQDSLFYRVMLMAQFEIIGGRDLKETYLEGIRNVTSEEVRQVAEKYLVKDQRTVGTLIPLKNNNDKAQISNHDKVH